MFIYICGSRSCINEAFALELIYSSVYKRLLNFFFQFSPKQICPNITYEQQQ
jgi:hypothetical protein